MCSGRPESQVANLHLLTTPPLPSLQMPIDAVCSPSGPLLAWLRRVRVRRLEFKHTAAAPLDDLGCQGFTSSEQRYRAAISTLLATIEFITNSAATLQ